MSQCLRLYSSFVESARSKRKYEGFSQAYSGRRMPQVASTEADVNSKHLKAAAELLTVRRDTIQLVDAENNRFREEQEKPKPKGRKAKEPNSQPPSDEPENTSPK